MKAKFRILNPSVLMEVKVGELFVPLGPELVECVCAVVNARDLEPAENEADGFLPLSGDALPEDRMAVVVVACRADPGEPEFYPAGYVTRMPSAAPVQMLDLLGPIAFCPKKADASASITVDAGPHGVVY